MRGHVRNLEARLDRAVFEEARRSVAAVLADPRGVSCLAGSRCRFGRPGLAVPGHAAAQQADDTSCVPSPGCSRPACRPVTTAATGRGHNRGSWSRWPVPWPRAGLPAWPSTSCTSNVGWDTPWSGCMTRPRSLASPRWRPRMDDTFTRATASLTIDSAAALLQRQDGTGRLQDRLAPAAAPGVPNSAGVLTPTLRRGFRASGGWRAGGVRR
jgi:hypothetical protein